MSLLIWRSVAGQILAYSGLLFLLLLPAGFVQAEHGPQSYRQVAGSVVRVLPTWPGYDRPGFGAPFGTAPEGTGFYISKGSGSTKATQSQKHESTAFILTAAHIVQNATRIELLDQSGRRFDGQILAIDSETDLALIEAGKQGPAVRLQIELPEIGEHACVVGNSFGLGLSLSCGVISAVERKNIGFNVVEDFIQTDAAVNPGASGGALISAEGLVTGLIDAIFTKEADIDAGVNFAISARLIDNVISDWREKGYFSEQH